MFLKMAMQPEMKYPSHSLLDVKVSLGIGGKRLPCEGALLAATRCFPREAQS